MVNSVLMKSGSPKAKPKVNHPKTQLTAAWTQPAELIVTSSTPHIRIYRRNVCRAQDRYEYAG